MRAVIPIVKHRRIYKNLPNGLPPALIYIPSLECGIEEEGSMQWINITAPLLQAKEAY